MILPIEIVSEIISMLNMKDTWNLLRTCKYYQNGLHLHKKIIHKTRNRSVYRDKEMLEIIYKNHQNYVIQFRLISKAFKKYQRSFNATKPLFNDKVLQFGSWYELEDVLYLVDIQMPGIFKYLLDRTFYADAILLAASCGQIDILRVLLKDARFDPALYNNYALCSAASYGHLGVVQVLLNDSRVDANDNCYEAFRRADMNGHKEIADILRKK